MPKMVNTKFVSTSTSAIVEADVTIAAETTAMNAIPAMISVIAMAIPPS